MPEQKNTTERAGTPADRAGDSLDGEIRSASVPRSLAPATDPRTAIKLRQLAAKIRSDAGRNAADYVLRHNTSHDGE